MKRRKRVSQEEQMSLGERWVTGDAYGELFGLLKKFPADDLGAVYARFVTRSRLTPTHTQAEVPEALRPKRFDAVPEIAALRRQEDGEGFVRILEQAWEQLDRVHPKLWTAAQILPLGIEFQRGSPGAFPRLLEGMRRFWAEQATSPFHALEREEVRRFLDFLAVERNLG